MGPNVWGARLATFALQCGLAVLLVLGWHFAVKGGVADVAFVGTPAGVWANLVEWTRDGSLLGNVLSTLSVLVAGFVIGTAAGCALGIWTGTSALVHAIVEPFMVFFNGMPRLILQPFFIIWLGYGFAAKTALVVAVIVILVAVNIAAALRELDRDLLANVRLMGAGTRDQILNVHLPSLSLAIIATSRSNIGFAFQATLVSEFVGTTEGLGHLIVRGQNLFNVDTIWATLVVVVLMSTVLDALLTRVERRATRWMPA